MRENTEVPVPPQDDSKPGNGLPNPDLNPMMNPTLGKNLGLWAQVYFTNPPEKREEAVQQLLRDLEKGVTPQQIQASTSQDEAGATPEQKPVEVTQAPRISEGILCPACLHRNDAKQRFCGLCGFTLRSKETKESAEEPPIIAPASAHIPAPPERNPDDWQWLHQRNLAELQTRKEHTAPWRVFSILGAVVVLAVFGYLFWVRGRTGASPAAPVPATVRGTAPAPTTAVPATGGQQSSPHPAETNATADAGVTNSPSQSEVLQGPGGADRKEEEVAREPLASSEDGAKELEMARRYLGGTASAKDGEAAAFWLWKAVKKNNDEAVLLLSDLYRKGEGVPQSCDQARVLLGAAAKRGSSAAGNKLKEINSSDCR